MYFSFSGAIGVFSSTFSQFVHFVLRPHRAWRKIWNEAQILRKASVNKGLLGRRTWAHHNKNPHFPSRPPPSRCKFL